MPALEGIAGTRSSEADARSEAEDPRALELLDPVVGLQVRTVRSLVTLKRSTERFRATPDGSGKSRDRRRSRLSMSSSRFDPNSSVTMTFLFPRPSRAFTRRYHGRT
jgi:hypothetical protein